MKNIVVVGMGYVGLSNAILLSQNHQVSILDIDTNKINLLNNKKSPISDKEVEEYLTSKNLHLSATNDKNVYQNADIIIVATPTDYNEVTNQFDTSSVDQVIAEAIQRNTTALIIIKSTVPVSYTQNLRDLYHTQRIVFSPEFLREGFALYDNLYPSRIIIGDQTDAAREFAELLLEGAIKKDTTVLFTNPTEAEAIKLFANTYLAMRVAYFNELDTYAEIHNLNTRHIIEGVSLDPRIGSNYNNPSFGYGGYCLPKDTKQLLSNYKDVPQDLIYAIVQSNSTRMDFITQTILDKKPECVGIYRLIMKQGSDNFRSSSMIGIIHRLRKENVEIMIYEPNLQQTEYLGYPIMNDLENFKSISDIIITNRLSPDLNNCLEKVYTRDLFGKDS